MDLRVERTYKLLCDAFEGLMAEKSFQDISVSELCERAMVRRSTFYGHFDDKNDFMAFYVRRFRDEISSNLASTKESGSFSRYCCDMTHEFVSEVSKRCDAVKYLKLGGGLPQFAFLVSKEIARQLEPSAERCFLLHGSMGDEAKKKAATFSAFYASGLLGLVSAWVESGCEASVQEFMDEYSSTVAVMVDSLL